MQNGKAIPPGYMTVGQLAKKMDVTVRTLQYYDKEGLLSPSAESEGGRRLYTDKDMVKLHQILSLKSIGFSLEEIKRNLVSLDTPADVAAALTQQAATLREKIAGLSASLKAIEALSAEVLQMQAVDFKKYADIIVNLQMNNEFYWLIKYFDDQTLELFRRRFNKESGGAMMEVFINLQQEAIRLQEAGVAPQSEQGRQFAASFWEMLLTFTDGDMSLLPQLMKFSDFDNPNQSQMEQQAVANAFIGPALEAYFDELGLDPLAEVHP